MNPGLCNDTKGNCFCGCPHGCPGGYFCDKCSGTCEKEGSVPTSGSWQFCCVNWQGTWSAGCKDINSTDKACVPWEYPYKCSGDANSCKPAPTSTSQSLGRIQGRRISDANDPNIENKSTIINIAGVPVGVSSTYTMYKHWETYNMSDSLRFGSSYTVSTVSPLGFKAYYSICNNCTDHPDSSFVEGNQVNVTIPNSVAANYYTGYVDLYWKYTAIPPTSTTAPAATNTPVPTATPTNTPNCVSAGNTCTVNSDCCNGLVCPSAIKFCVYPTPTSTPTPGPSSTPTASPSPTPTLTPTAGPSTTGGPTATSGPSATVNPSATGGSAPSATPNPTSISCDLKSEGDADCDGKVDLVDYSIWLNSQCQSSCTDLRADFGSSSGRGTGHYDQKVDDADLAIWINFNDLK